MKKTIYKEVAQELNIPEYLVEKVAKHPFKCTEEVMKKGDFENVMLKHLGKFIVKPARLKFLNNGKSTPIQNDSDSEQTSEE